MSQVIKPTNGRIVWFTPGGDFPGKWHDIQQPLAATVCHVWGDRMVNLDVIDSEGFHWAASSVDLVQPGDKQTQYGARYCEWMPFQKGQAAKTEAAEAKVADKPAAPLEPVAQSIMQGNEPITPAAWSPSCKAAKIEGDASVCGFPSCDCHLRAVATCTHPACSCLEPQKCTRWP